MEKFSLNSQKVADYLNEGKRFDGRKPEEFRELKIETGVSENAEGSARVTLGKTDVIVGVKMALGEPYPDSPNKGNFMVSAELAPMSSPRFEAGPPKFPVIEFGRVLDRGLRESGFINWEGLCLEEGKKVWTMFVDIYTLNDDGNLMDAAGIGAIAAMKTARLPGYDEETGKLDYKNPSDNPLPLNDVTPIAITAYKVGDRILVDPTREEQDAATARITIGSSDGIISSVQKGEESPMTPEEIGEAFDVADTAYKEVFKNLEKQIK
ncbi:exosome complex protein Rrp42 [Candidatus Pacearchaeota archaeon]|nr:exosome complex protein Rrp42 [Candidatus Pacearchaeota archaeon]